MNTDWLNHYPCSEIPSSFPEFNTGILLFKNGSRVTRLFELWSDLYTTFRKKNPNQQINDQPFFRVAVYQSDVRVATLTREHNCKFRGQGYLNGAVKILHGHHKFKLDPDHVTKVIQTLNGSTRPRVYIAGKVYEQKIVGRLEGQRVAHFVGRFPEPPESITLLRLKRLRQIIQEYGFGWIIKKLASLILPQ